ncbi:Synaptosomal-associated protein 29 [Larimichthys crocea]|uniref:Uncharacterized protein n=1 Tax=Larimichthys crocea TaxID=215358 RepID=A0ACD3Q9Q1_LARCR|nr:Synaptosomal-associated protein 29 [Larimichthys crocea]
MKRALLGERTKQPSGSDWRSRTVAMGTVRDDVTKRDRKCSDANSQLIKQQQRLQLRRSKMAYPKSHNPFADDDDEEDFKPKRRGFDDDDDPDDSGLSEAERKQRYLQQEVMRTAQSAVDSSYRSISLIYESEKMGVGNRRGASATRLQSAISSSREQEDKYQASHPNLRKLDTGGFGAGASLDNDSSRQNGYPQNRHLREAHQTLDNNLDEMCSGLSRLKNLGLGLQSEIENQDNSIDSLLNKVDKMDLKIHNTNQQIKNLK